MKNTYYTWACDWEKERTVKERSQRRYAYISLIWGEIPLNRFIWTKICVGFTSVT